MTKVDEKVIIEQVLAGNQEAYRRLIELYQDYVYTICFRVVKNHEDAEELASDTFVKAYQNLKRFRKESKFSTWLYRIAYNAALSKIRKKRIQGDSLSEVEEYRLPVDKFIPAFQGIVDQDQAFYLTKAINQLSTQEQTLITLYYLQENSIEEVSKITGTKQNNIKVKIHRARKKLYRLLSGMLKNEIDEII